MVVVEGGVRAALVRDRCSSNGNAGADELVRVGCTCAVAAREEGVAADVVLPRAARGEQKEKEEVEMMVVREGTDLEVVEQAMMSSKAMVMVR